MPVLTGGSWGQLWLSPRALVCEGVPWPSLAHSRFLRMGICGVFGMVGRWSLGSGTHLGSQSLQGKKGLWVPSPLSPKTLLRRAQPCSLGMVMGDRRWPGLRSLFARSCRDSGATVPVSHVARTLSHWSGVDTWACQPHVTWGKIRLCPAPRPHGDPWGGPRRRRPSLS